MNSFWCGPVKGVWPVGFPWWYFINGLQKNKSHWGHSQPTQWWWWIRDDGGNSLSLTFKPVQVNLYISLNDTWIKATILVFFGKHPSLELVTDLFVYPVLVDGPDCGYVGGEELWERHPLVAGPGTDQPGLPHRVVAHQDTFHQLRPRLFVVHLNYGNYEISQSLLSPLSGS